MYIRKMYNNNFIYSQRESSGKNIENEYNRALEENQRLLQEVASLKVGRNSTFDICLFQPEWSILQTLMCH